LRRRAESVAGASEAARARRATWLLIAVAGGVFIAADDQTSVVTVLPALIPDVGLTVDEFYLASWVVNGYLLGYIVALPIVGRIADAYGHARVYAGALALFMLGSALVAAAPGFEWLVAARALQAVGGGAVVPVAMAIVVGELPPARRALGLGAIAAASEAGALIGPLWGGAITEAIGWRWVFWLNLPPALPVLVAVWLLAGRGRAGGRVDWPGAALLTGALTALTVAIADDPIAPRAWWLTALLLAASAALALAFVARQRGAREPMVRLAMFAPRPVWGAVLASLLVGGGLITALISVPLFVNLVLLERPIDGGVTLLRFTAAVPLGALAGGWLVGRLGPRAPALAGMWLGAAGFAGLLAWGASLSEVWRTLPLLAGGFGFGLVIAPLGAAVLERVRADERATAASWLTLARVLGMLVGTGLLASNGLGRFYARAGAIEFGSEEFEALVSEAQVSTFHEVWVAAAAAMILAGVTAWLLGGRGEAGARSTRAASWWAAR
jgi:MFS family permease